MIEIDHTTIKMNSEDNKEYFINWKKHLSHFQNAFDHLFTSNELTDVTLYCEGKKLGAHKILLSACSAYFRETFKEVPCQHPVIILYGVEYSVLSDLLRFIYKGEVSVDTSKLDSFLKLAQHLQISGLTDNCSEQLITESNEHLEATTSSQTPQDTTCTEQYSILMPGDETRKSVKRTVPPTVVEQETLATKIQKQNDNPLLISESDVKCEPDELVTYFEDPLEDPLQSDQTQDMQEFFEDGAGYSAGEEEVKTIPEESDAATFNLLPAKSKERYISVLKKFRDWMKTKDFHVITEEVMVAYFNELIGKFAPPSLWSTYSMLKSTLFVFDKVDISKFKILCAILKSKSKGYKSKKTKTFELKDVERFINQAPDEVYLFMKMAVVMGIMGACRCDELVSLKTTDIEDRESVLVVNIVKTKNYKPRSFVVTGAEGKSFNGLEIYRKYAALRPKSLGEGRFFLGYRSGKCTVQPVGINTMSKIPKLVATYLKLKDAHLYTGHCFRRTSATLLVNASADILTLKMHGGWRSSSIAKSYVEQSVTSKLEIARKIVGGEEDTSKKDPLQDDTREESE